MNALMRCVSGLDPEKLEEDEWFKLWGQVYFYLEVVNQVKFES